MENITNFTSLTCSQLLALPTNESSSATIIEDRINCQLNVFLTQFSPFISLVQNLLHYGTTVCVAVGLLLNILSLVVLTRKKMRKSTSSMFLSVLAIYDSLALTLNFMIGVIRGQNVEANRSFQENEHLCKLHGVLVELFNLLSVWTIVVFTLQRYFIVKFPLKAKLFTLQKTLVVILAVSFAVLVFSSHKIFVTGFEGDSVFGYKGCQTNRAQIPGIVYFYVAFNTWLPTFIITVFNFAIIREIKTYQVKRQQMTNSTMSRTDQKATKLLLTVSFTYLLLVLPLGIVQTIELFWNAKMKSLSPAHGLYVESMIVKYKLKWVRAFFFFFYQLNFAVNFFLYVLSASGARFRYTLQRVFGIKAQFPASETQWPTATRTNMVVPLQDAVSNMNSRAEP